MKSKLLSLTLIIALLSSFLIIPGAGAAFVQSGEAQKILSDLGVIEASEDVNAPITRGEFASEISRVMNVESLPEGYVLPFTDVAPGSKHYAGVYNLYAWRAISSADLFRPEDVITTNEALKIAVSLLGYDFLALANGGYPGGYTSAASQLGIVPKGLTNPVTKANAYDIMLSMLHTKMPSVTINGDGNNDYTAKTGDLMLKEMWNLEYTTGMVTDGQGFGINYTNGVGDGFVSIDGLKLKKGLFDTDSYFGEEVDVYYEAKTLKIRAIYARSDSGKRVTTLHTSQNITFNKDTYTYIDAKDKEEEISIADDATIIINGENVRYDATKMVPANGYVKLISLEGKDADVVVIKSYIEAVVGTKNETDFLVSDIMNEGKSYVFDSEYITYTNQDGVVCEFKDIQVNDILWISEKANKEISDVVICSDVIAGELTGTSGNSVYIDDRSYEASENALNDIKANYQFGAIVRGCINPDGKIVYFVPQKSSDSTTVGYLMYSRLQARGLFSAATVKFLGTDGLVKEYTISDILRVNDKVFKGTAADIYAKLPKQPGNEKSMVSSLVVYNADRSDRLTSVVYPDDVAKAYGFEPYGFYKNAQVVDPKIGDEENTYIQYNSSDRALYSKNNERIFPSSSMVRFQVPDPAKANDYEDKDYKVAGFPSSNSMSDINHYGYTTIEGQLQSDYVVGVFYDAAGSAGELGASSSLLLVTSVSQVINDEGDEVERIEVVRPNGTTAEYFSSEMGYFSKIGIKFGDIVKINADAKNMVTGIAAFYQGPDSETKTDKLCNKALDVTATYSEQEDGTILNNNIGMSTLATSIILLGSVYDSDGLVFKLLTTNHKPEEYKDETLYTFSMYGKNIVYCDLKTETVSTLTAGEVKSYLDFGTNCHKAVIQTYCGTVTALFVFAY